MASITKLSRKKGPTWKALIRIRHKGKIIHSEAKTFRRKREAERWARERESELYRPEEFAKLQRGVVTVNALIEKYLRYLLDRQQKGKDVALGRTKKTTLRNVNWVN